MSLQEVRNQRIYLQSQLKNYLNDPITNEKEITITRGRILRAYVKEYNLETDLGVKARIQTLIRQEADLHKSQVNERIKKVKADKNFFRVALFMSFSLCFIYLLKFDLLLITSKKIYLSFSINSHRLFKY